MQSMHLKFGFRFNGLGVNALSWDHIATDIMYNAEDNMNYNDMIAYYDFL